VPDPSVEAALKEAYASAPSEDVIVHTLEVRHPLFVDEDGNPDSIWVTTNESPITATIEEDAPVRGGEAVDFVSFPFTFSLAPIENTAVKEIQITIDNVDRRIVENLDLAVADTTKIQVCYRPFLASDLTGPQMDPPPTFTLSSVTVTALTVTARARISIDLNGAFPRRIYTAAEFPALIGQ
jgi:hypothetical protein